MNGLASSFLLAAVLQVAPAQTQPTQIVISPERAEIEVAETARLTVTAQDGAGLVLDDLPVRWVASTPELASVSADGVVTGLNPGMARITAVVDRKPVSVSVVIRALPATRLIANVGSDEPYAGQVIPVWVSASNRLGEPVKGPELSWSSSNPDIAAVDAAGLVFARQAGSTTISVSGGTVSTSLELRVKPDPGISYRLEPTESRVRTGDAFGSLRCDCGPQLQTALRMIQDVGWGCLVYLRQEGRGIGLHAKIQAYNLQDRGVDTLDANLMLGHPADARDYGIASEILHSVGIEKVNLMTNNPDKVEQLSEYGINVVERMEIVAGVGEGNLDYLSTKANRMGHQISEDNLEKQ